MVLTRSEQSTAAPVGPPTDANGGGFAAGAEESGLVSMVEVEQSTELLPVGPRSGRADEDGEGAFAAVVEETVAALVRSRLVFLLIAWEEAFVDHLLCFLLMVTLSRSMRNLLRMSLVQSETGGRVMELALEVVDRIKETTVFN